eukprot:6195114-Pleurochrysis_carterae.AAC.1
MLTHCEQMCQQCEVCRKRDAPSSGEAMATQTSSKIRCSYSTLYHRPQGAKGHRNQYLLVIVDMLTVTRFVSRSVCSNFGEERLVILTTHVFIEYSFSQVIKPDNSNVLPTI